MIEFLTDKFRDKKKIKNGQIVDSPPMPNVTYTVSIR